MFQLCNIFCANNLHYNLELNRKNMTQMYNTCKYIETNCIKYQKVNARRVF